MLIFISIILVFIIILTVFLLAESPGKPRPYLDSVGNKIKGSISEKTHISINGLEQGMFIKSKDSSNPVLLYLHGGMPDYFLTKKYPTGLEDYFTVVWWEQRGSGLSYSSGIPAGSISLEQMMADTREVTNYLRKRFRKDKIYLMGHSGGTFIGIQVASKMPELYYAYIAVAQMSFQLESEILAQDFMLMKYSESGNRKMVRKLKEAKIINGIIPDAYYSLRDPAMHRLGIGTTRDMNSVISGIFIPSLLCRDYTLTEKINLWIGKSRSGISSLWKEMVATDLTTKKTELDIPVYFVHGLHDYTVSYALAKEYFEKLKAPVKGFYTFEQSAHSPIFEEPARMKKIMQQDILKGFNDLSDK